MKLPCTKVQSTVCTKKRKKHFKLKDVRINLFKINTWTAEEFSETVPFMHLSNHDFQSQ